MTKDFKIWRFNLFFALSDILQQVARQVQDDQVAARQIQEVYRAEAVVRPVHQGKSHTIYGIFLFFLCYQLKLKRTRFKFENFS